VDTVRYVVALIVVVSFPASVLAWLVLHPFIGFWRRLGPVWTMVIVGLAALATWVLLFLVRHPLLAVEFGTNIALVPGAIVSYVVAVVLEVRCRKHLKLGILVGLPEIDPEGRGTKLLTDGIYGKVRHPRYLAFTFALLAIALFCNYLTVYLYLPGLALAFHFVVLAEEKELHDRFGADYASYCARVPRFIPRRRSA
jgi:protein-S-isoprenylcysteine O-methyltransferase Ste14